MMPKNNQDISKPSVYKGNKENTRLNVILITLDAFNLKLFEKNLKTLPNMKELKDKSVFFENAFSIGPSTFFSFPGIIGSVYPYHFGIGLDKNLKSIDEVLKSYGYNTAVINESNALLTPFYGYCRRVDYQNHFLNLSHAEVDRKLNDKFLGKDKENKKSKKQNDRIKKISRILDSNKRVKAFGKYLYGIYKLSKLYLSNNTENFQERKKLYNEFRNAVLEFINRRFEAPQFLWIHTIINHLPYFPPADSKFSESEINYLNYRGLSGLVNPKICERLKRLYVESMRRTDMLIGDIINTLEANNLIDNSIIIITADHGEEFMEEGHFGHSPESSSDRLLRVPLIFKAPKIFKPKKYPCPVSTIDILPTVCDLLGLELPESSRGKSLKSLFLDSDSDNLRRQKEFWERPIYSEAWATSGLLDRSPAYMSNKKIFTVRKDQYKLKVTQKQKDENVVVEDFDLKNWVTGKRMNIKDNYDIFEELRCSFYTHLYEEGIFVKNLRRKSEEQRIKKALNNLKKLTYRKIS